MYFVKYIVGHHVLRVKPKNEGFSRCCKEEKETKVGVQRDCNYDIVFYLDIVDGEPKNIVRVECTFGETATAYQRSIQPSLSPASAVVWNRPKRISSTVWRCFESYQNDMEDVPPRITFTMLGYGGTIHTFEYCPNLNPINDRNNDDGAGFKRGSAVGYFAEGIATSTCRTPERTTRYIDGRRRRKKKSKAPSSSSIFLKPLNLPIEREFYLERIDIQNNHHNTAAPSSPSPPLRDYFDDDDGDGGVQVVPQQQQQLFTMIPSWHHGESGLQQLTTSSFCYHLDNNNNNNSNTTSTSNDNKLRNTSADDFINTVIYVKLFKLIDNNHNSNNNNTNAAAAEKKNSVISLLQLNKKNLDGLLKLNINFIKYEEGIDHILRINREKVIITDNEKTIPVRVPNRTPSSAISNRDSLRGETIQDKYNTLMLASNNVDDTIHAMNPNTAETYKLNYRKEHNNDNDDEYLVAKFILDAVPNDDDLLAALVRFCVHFVHNSFEEEFQTTTTPAPPTTPCQTEQEKIDDEFEHLFSTIVRDRVIEERLWLREEKDEDTTVSSDNDDGANNPALSCQNSDDSLSVSYLSTPISLPFDNADANSKIIYFETTESSSRLGNEKPHHQQESYGRNNKLAAYPLSSPPANINTRTIMNSNEIIRSSDLTMEKSKNLSAAKLKRLLKKLNAHIGNQKRTFLKDLQEYIIAREKEVKSLLKGDYNTKGCGGNVLGIEFCMEENNLICHNNDANIILKGGRKYVFIR